MNLDPILLKKISKQSGTSAQHTLATLDLLENQTAILFIARYCRDITGNLNEASIREIAELYSYYKDLSKRRQSILTKIQEQGRLTDDLKNRILTCYDTRNLEALYAPFRFRGKTKGTVAKIQGLEPLAKYLWEQVSSDKSLSDTVEEYLPTGRQLGTEEALEGALHIVAEWIVNDSTIRSCVKELMLSERVFVSKVLEGKQKEKTIYDTYNDFHEAISRIPFHSISAMRREVKQDMRTFNVEVDDEKVLQWMRKKLIGDAASEFSPYLETAIKDSYFKLLKSKLRGEVRSHLKERFKVDSLKIFQTKRSDLQLSDLHQGMIVEGTIMNIKDFGAFVDVGVQHDGLIHISELSKHFVQDPSKAVQIGQVVKVKVIGVDENTKRISLSIKALQSIKSSITHKNISAEKLSQNLGRTSPRVSVDGQLGSPELNIRAKVPVEKSSALKPPRRQTKKNEKSNTRIRLPQKSYSSGPKDKDLPDTSKLSFPEKLQLLQKKFSGIS